MMRIKRQPRAKRHKTCVTRDQSETCEPSPMSQSQSPDLSEESFVGSSAEMSPTHTTPMHELSPPYASHFQPEPEQPLPTPSHPNVQWDATAYNQHRASPPQQWNAPEFNHHQMPYGMAAGMSQPTYPFTLPSCSPPAGQAPPPAPFESPPAEIEQYYTNQTQSPTHLNFNAIPLSHGLGPATDIKMNTQATSAYSAWIEPPRWDATPGSYNQQYQQPNTQHPHSYQ